ncbi:MAG: hypothetical protein Aurels2KO_53360 [Aureliella sp.]
MNEKYLTFRGDVRSLVSLGEQIAIATQHSEGEPLGLYILDPAKSTVAEIAVPTGGQALFGGESGLWLIGSDSVVYRCDVSKKTVTSICSNLPDNATVGCTLAGGQLAIAAGEQLFVVDGSTGEMSPAVPVEHPVTALGASPDGDWLAVGTETGHVCVYEFDGSQLKLSDRAKLHGAAVTALLFEPEELRFLSAGDDQKLLLTHARGKLDPEDRGKSAGHKGRVTRLLHAPGERFISASRDRSCKTWTLSGAARPATLSDAVPVCVDATIVTVHDRPHLVVSGEDNALRLFLLDAGGKFGALTHRYHDAYARAARLAKSNNVADRGEAITALSDYGDRKSLEAIEKIAASDADAGLRVRATGALGSASHPRATPLLEPLLKHNDARVRLEAFEGLLSKSQPGDLGVLEAAIAAGAKNIGLRAIEVLKSRAKKEDDARQLLIRILEASHADVRVAAMLALESVFPKTAPDANVIAAKSGSADVRRFALFQFFHRRLLGKSRVDSIVRRLGDDSDAEVRQVAFLVMLLSNSKLATAVRQHDKELHRQLHDVETFALVVDESDEAGELSATQSGASNAGTAAAKKSAKSKATVAEPPKAKRTKARLADADLEPLLTALSASSTDTCLRGAAALAYLGDSRALGTLLQLSRDNAPDFRVQVARALASLGDGRSRERLRSMLDDEALEVRDAAYSSLVKLCKDEPLAASDAGQMSQFADVRRRALQTLVATVRKSTAKSTKTLGQAMLLQLLNDADAKVRSEAFKATLTLELCDEPAETLKFILGSTHADVRREVLTEAMAQDREPWALELLEQLLSDANDAIRHDAFEHLNQRTKGRDAATIQLGLGSQYADLRLDATRRLAKLKTDQAQDALLGAIHDEDREIRLLAIESLVTRGASELLHEALDSQYVDLQVAAAVALARIGDQAVLQTLYDIVLEEEPEAKHEKELWVEHVVSALGGIGCLRPSEAAENLRPLIASKHATIRRSAARAIAESSAESDSPTLVSMLQHDDESVVYAAAYGVGLQASDFARPIVFTEKAETHLGLSDSLVMAAAYGASAESRLVELLDAPEDWVARAAMVTLFARDLLDHDGTPRRIILALSARSSRARLWAARALEHFADPAALQTMLADLVNDWGVGADNEKSQLDIDPQTAGMLTECAVFGDPRLIAAFELLESESQDKWKHRWDTFRQAWRDEIQSAVTEAAKRRAELPKVESDPEELHQLAFGTYVGLAREGGASGRSRAKPATGSAARAAITRLAELSAADESAAATIQPVLIQSLSNRLHLIRMLAFEKLREIPMADDALAEASLESGFNDVAIEGLKLLASGGSAGSSPKGASQTKASVAKTRQVLEQALADCDESLALDIAKLLAEKTDIAVAAESVLQCHSVRARNWCLQKLGESWDSLPAAKKCLQEATSNPIRSVQLTAAEILADKGDSFAFEVLGKLLTETSENSSGGASGDRVRQRRIVDALLQLRHEGTSELLLQRLIDDPGKTADETGLLGGIGQLRERSVASKMLQLVVDEKLGQRALTTVLQISGHDQPIVDPLDESEDRSWLEEQHPRHDDVLAELLATLTKLSIHRTLAQLIPAARWSLSGAVDDPLSQLANSADASVRERAVEAIGWRLKHRDGPSETLVELLNHKEPTTKFLAAEGLALAGRDEGISVLLSAVELMQDLTLRNRAVKALGELSSPRAWDLLLRLVNDDTHALRDVAAEAIGHLGTTERREEVFGILKRLAGGYSSAAGFALRGLRWLDIAQSWQLIREHARRDCPIALEQLGYNDEPETRDLLLKALEACPEEENYRAVEAAEKAARKLFGAESLQPDYAILRGQTAGSYGVAVDTLRRVCERGEPLEILKLMKCPHPDIRDRLQTSLLSRETLPSKEAVELLESEHAGVAEGAARLVGRAGEKAHEKALVKAFVHWQAEWNHCDSMVRQGREVDTSLLDAITSALVSVAWALGQMPGGRKELLECAQADSRGQAFVPVRLAAIAALSKYKLVKANVEVLQEVAADPDYSVRAAAAQLLARQAPGQVDHLLQSATSDRGVFRRLSKFDSSEAALAAKTVADSVHQQGVALPTLIADENVTVLTEVARNRNLDELTRLGGIEGLAKIASEEAEQSLLLIAGDDEANEDLRKAAWRGLRRSKRVRTKRELVEG